MKKLVQVAIVATSILMLTACPDKNKNSGGQPQYCDQFGNCAGYNSPYNRCNAGGIPTPYGGGVGYANVGHGGAYGGVGYGGGAGYGGDPRFNNNSRYGGDPRYNNNSRYGGDPRYNNNSRYGGVMHGGGAGYNYQWMNGRCLDINHREVRHEVDPSYCENTNYSYAQDCDYYGGYQPQFGNAPQSNICNPGDQPIYFPATGATMCMQMSYYDNFNNMYGQPVQYGGAVMACAPGYSNYPTSCSCNTFGGSLGWAWAGASIGFCY